MEKPNLVPSSVIFLFLQQHFLFLFFFKFSTENASSVSRLGRLEKESSRSQILETLWEEITGEDVQEELRWVGSFSLWWSDESFSLRVLQKKRDKKKKQREETHTLRYFQMLRLMKSSQTAVAPPEEEEERSSLFLPGHLGRVPRRRPEHGWEIKHSSSV